MRTVTLANLYWEQGDRETAVGIVEGILVGDPGDARAREWMVARGLGEAPQAPAPPPQATARAGATETESELAAFLERIAKEYGHGVSRDH